MGDLTAPPLSRSPGRIAAIVAGACVIAALITSAQLYVPKRMGEPGTRPWVVLGFELFEWAMWGLVAPVIWRIDARWGFRARAWPRALALLRVVGRIREVVAGREHRPADAGALEPAQPATGYRSRLGVKVEGRTTLLDLDDVDWIEAVGSCVRVYAGRTRAMVRTTLAELETSLDPRRFFRIHRSALVNLDRVRHLEHWSHGDYLVVLADGTELRLSRGRRRAMEGVLGTAL